MLQAGVRRVIVVGGVAGGASCAARLRRLTEKAEITIYERGNAVSFANCGLPYFVGGIIPVRSGLDACDRARRALHCAGQLPFQAHPMLPLPAYTLLQHLHLPASVTTKYGQPHPAYSGLRWTAS